MLYWLVYLLVFLFFFIIWFYVSVTAIWFVLKNIYILFLQDLEIAAEFIFTSGVSCILQALKHRKYVKVLDFIFLSITDND